MKKLQGGADFQQFIFFLQLENQGIANYSELVSPHHNFMEEKNSLESLSVKA